MRTHILGPVGLLALLLAAAPATARAQSNPSRGLWVGDVTLNAVNESVVGIDVSNNVVAPDPSVTTPVNAPAHIRIIFHVDSTGQVRLLKSVAILAKDTNNPPDLALVTDPTLYPNFTGVSSIGSRISTAAFDFGDSFSSQILNQVAAAAANAAANNQNATTTASQVVQAANLDANYLSFVQGAAFHTAVVNAAAAASAGVSQTLQIHGTPSQVTAAAFNAATNNGFVLASLATAMTLQSNALFQDTRYVAAVNSVSTAAAAAAANSANLGNTNISVYGLASTNAALLALTNAINAPSAVTPQYLKFIATPTFLATPGLVGPAATSAAASARNAGALPQQVLNAANAGALLALANNGVFAAADTIVVNEVKLNGNFAAGGTVSGSIYLGANHPTNPFRHRMHPDHSTGYAITRALTVQFDPPTSTNLFQSAAYGVDALTGSYREEISGLHKPLGAQQNIGLITTGKVTLNRVSLVDTLNQ